jgi:hypothetical protein
MKWNQKAHWQLQQLKKAQQSQKSEKPKPEAPVNEQVTEPVVAVRVWNIAIVGGMPYLRSTFKSEFVWPYRKPIEQDVMANMGIHAIKRDNKVDASWSNYAGYISGTPQYSLESLIQSYKAEVMGEVYLWGRVQEMEWGYLAEFAYPKRLWVAPQTDVITLMQLEDEYGVPCDTHDALDKTKHAPALTVTYIQSVVNGLNYPLQSAQNAMLQQQQQNMMQQAQNYWGMGLGNSKGLLGGL